MLWAILFLFGVSSAAAAGILTARVLNTKEDAKYRSNRTSKIDHQEFELVSHIQRSNLRIYQLLLFIVKHDHLTPAAEV
ncbi:hypothetical protein B0H13DRAFT_2293259 [Mycena leptocephala]|nr:hypothetical protein B0H13DRAFT_2293259 [Mycena leptocephala]